jgi:FkbM family methyltransferase
MALSDFFWDNKCYLYMRGDVVSKEISLNKRTTSDANDFLMGSKNPIVVDIGMHNADDSGYFLKRGTRVSSVEADDALVDNASRHPTLLLAQKLGRFKLNHCAMNHHQEGSILPIQPEVIFYERPENSEWNSLSDESCKRTYGGCKEVRKKAKTCAQIVLEATQDTNERVWYMKVDIEGADVVCLKSLEALPREKRPIYVSTEDQKEGLTVLDMESIGYDGFKLVAHKMNDKKGGYGGLPPEVLGEGDQPRPDTWRTAREIRADGFYGGINNLVGQVQYDLFACMGCVNN